MDPWYDQLERVPDLSDEEKEEALAILNNPQHIKDPDFFFARPEAVVKRLRKLFAHERWEC